MLITYATNDFPTKYVPTVSFSFFFRSEYHENLFRYLIIML